MAQSVPASVFWVSSIARHAPNSDAHAPPSHDASPYGTTSGGLFKSLLGLAPLGSTYRWREEEPTRALVFDKESLEPVHEVLVSPPVSNYHFVNGCGGNVACVAWCLRVCPCVPIQIDSFSFGPRPRTSSRLPRRFRWERPATEGGGVGGGRGGGAVVVEVLVAKHRAPREAVESQFKDMCVGGVACFACLACSLALLACVACLPACLHATPLSELPPESTIIQHPQSHFDLINSPPPLSIHNRYHAFFTPELECETWRYAFCVDPAAGVGGGTLLEAEPLPLAQSSPGYELPTVRAGMWTRGVSGCWQMRCSFFLFFSDF
jgi:hypothetical protein